VAHDVWVYAARGGQLHVLEWLRKKSEPWPLDVLLEAASFGQLHVLKWARENGCPWPDTSDDILARRGIVWMVLFAPTRQLEILQWDSGYPIRQVEVIYALKVAALKTNIEALQWLWGQRQARCCKNLLVYAGDTTTLQWLRDRGIEWNENSCVEWCERHKLSKELERDEEAEGEDLERDAEIDLEIDRKAHFRNHDVGN